MPCFESPENIALFEKYGVYTEAELHSRVEILLDEYSKTISIEAATMIDMAKKDIIPAVSTYIKELAQTAELAKTCGADVSFETDMVKRLSSLTAAAYRNLGVLETALENAKAITDVKQQANAFRDSVIPAMNALRAPADEIESLVGEKYWPYPTYGALLFYVK